MRAFCSSSSGPFLKLCTLKKITKLNFQFTKARERKKCPQKTSCQTMRPKSRWLSKQINQLCTCKYKILITFGVLSTIICLVPNLFNLMLCRPLKWTLPKRTCYYPSRKKCFSDRTLVTLIEKLTQVQVTKVSPNIFALFRVQKSDLLALKHSHGTIFNGLCCRTISSELFCSSVGFLLSLGREKIVLPCEPKLC